MMAGKMMKKMKVEVSNLMTSMMSGMTGRQTDIFKQQTDAKLIPIIQNCLNKTKKKLKEKKEKKEKHDKEEKQERSFKKTKDPMKLLKLKFVEGLITEEDYLRKKKILEE